MQNVEAIQQDVVDLHFQLLRWSKLVLAFLTPMYVLKGGHSNLHTMKRKLHNKKGEENTENDM